MRGNFARWGSKAILHVSVAYGFAERASILAGSRTVIKTLFLLAFGREWIAQQGSQARDWLLLMKLCIISIQIPSIGYSTSRASSTKFECSSEYCSDISGYNFSCNCGYLPNRTAYLRYTSRLETRIRIDCVGLRQIRGPRSGPRLGYPSV